MKTTTTNLIILAAAFALAGCGTFPPKEQIQIVWHKSDNPSFRCNNPKVAHNKVLAGCQYWEGMVCHVVAPDGADDETLGILGHETKHCFDGGWHK